MRQPVIATKSASFSPRRVSSSLTPWAFQDGIPEDASHFEPWGKSPAALCRSCCAQLTRFPFGKRCRGRHGSCSRRRPWRPTRAPATPSRRWSQRNRTFGASACRPCNWMSVGFRRPERICNKLRLGEGRSPISRCGSARRCGDWCASKFCHGDDAYNGGGPRTTLAAGQKGDQHLQRVIVAPRQFGGMRRPFGKRRDQRFFVLTQVVIENRQRDATLEIGEGQPPRAWAKADSGGKLTAASIARNGG